MTPVVENEFRLLGFRPVWETAVFKILPEIQLSNFHYICLLPTAYCKLPIDRPPIARLTSVGMLVLLVVVTGAEAILLLITNASLEIQLQFNANPTARPKEG